MTGARGWRHWRRTEARGGERVPWGKLQRESAVNLLVGVIRKRVAAKTTPANRVILREEKNLAVKLCHFYAKDIAETATLVVYDMCEDPGRHPQKEARFRYDANSRQR